MVAYTIHCKWICGLYVRRNYHRSLEYAILQEKEWEKIKPKDEDEEEYEEEEEEAPAAEAEGAEAAGDAEGEE